MPTDGSRLPIRVLLADDHALLRQSLKLLLERRSEVMVVGEAADGYEAIALAGSLRPDVVLMDINMPQLNGIEATQQIVAQQRRVRVIMLSAYGERRQLVEAVRAGALGYLVKRSDIDEVLAAMRVVSTGNCYFSAELSGSFDIPGIIFDARAGAKRGTACGLSPREAEIVQLLVEGLTYKSCAKNLSLSEKTVEGHCERAMAKLGTKTRADLVRVVMRDGINGLRWAPEPLQFPAAAQPLQSLPPTDTSNQVA